MTETTVKNKPVTLVPIDEARPTRKSEIAQVVGSMCQVMGEDAQPHTAREYEIMKGLVTHWLDLKEEIAKERIDATLLPDLYVEMVEANIPREEITGEKWRNRASSVSRAFWGAVAGLFLGALQEIVNAMALCLERAPYILAGLGVFLVSCILKLGGASQTGEPLTREVLGDVLAWSLAWGILATVTVMAAIASYRAIERHNKREAAKKRERLLGPADATGESNA